MGALGGKGEFWALLFFAFIMLFHFFCSVCARVLVILDGWCSDYTR